MGFFCNPNSNHNSANTKLLTITSYNYSTKKQWLKKENEKLCIKQHHMGMFCFDKLLGWTKKWKKYFSPVELVLFFGMTSVQRDEEQAGLSCWKWRCGPTLTTMAISLQTQEVSVNLKCNVHFPTWCLTGNENFQWVYQRAALLRKAFTIGIHVAWQPITQGLEVCFLSETKQEHPEIKIFFWVLNAGKSNIYMASFQINNGNCPKLKCYWNVWWTPLPFGEETGLCWTNFAGDVQIDPLHLCNSALEVCEDCPFSAVLLDAEVGIFVTSYILSKSVLVGIKRKRK